jgi:hypothetical protein
MNDHIPDATKMISDTPRMQSALLDHPDAGFAKIWQVGCDIERELNAAQERINQLKEELMDAKNKYAALVADVALYEDRGERIKRLEEAENRMLNWLTEDCPESVKKQLSNAWMKSKEAKP